MAITPFTQGVSQRLTPINQNFLAGLQAQQLNMYSQTKQREHQDFLQGEALSDASDRLVNSVRAYGPDKERLQQIQKTYGDAIKNKIASAKGDYSQLIPYMKGMRRELETNLQSGELGQIQTRYTTAQKNIEGINKRVTEGKLPAYMESLAMQDPLTPIADYVDIGKELNTWVNSSATKGKTFNEVHQMAQEYVQNNLPMARQLAYARAAGDAYFNSEMRVIEDVVRNKFRMPDPADGSGGTSDDFAAGTYNTASEEFDFGTTRDSGLFGQGWVGGTSDEEYANIKGRIRPMKGDAIGDQKDLERRIDYADKGLEDQSFGYRRWEKASDMSNKTKLVKSTLGDVPVFQLGGNGQGQLVDILEGFKDDEKVDEFWKTFQVVGQMQNNPYLDGALYATAKVGGKTLRYAVGDPGMKDTKQGLMNNLYMDILPSYNRLTGEAPVRNLSGGRKARSIPVINIDGLWGYEVEYKDGEGNTTILTPEKFMKVL